MPPRKRRVSSLEALRRRRLHAECREVRVLGASYNGRASCIPVDRARVPSRKFPFPGRRTVCMVRRLRFHRHREAIPGRREPFRVIRACSREICAASRGIQTSSRGLWGVCGRLRGLSRAIREAPADSGSCSMQSARLFPQNLRQFPRNPGSLPHNSARVFPGNMRPQASGGIDSCIVEPS